MSGVTGIELGPNFCVLVRGGRLGSHRTVSAASAILPSAWPDDRTALVERLREAKRTNDLSTRARVVAWGDEDSLSPLTDAGFEIASVLQPAQALARVVRARQVGAPAGTAVAALSLNFHGAAIAIVAGSEVIHSRVFEWPLGTPFLGVRPELLDRYLLVSQIAPQLRHDIDLVRPVHGATVASVVACGNLPNLRSLAMLLIEEMDLEIETLDSGELLDPGVPPGTLSEAVASLQLAAAVASSAENRVPVHADSESAAAAGLEADQPAARPARFGRRLQGLAAVAALVLSAAWSSLQIAGSSPARPIFPDGIAPAVLTAVPERPELRTEATTGRDSLQMPRAAPDAARGPATAPQPAAARPIRRRAPGVPEASDVPLPTVDGIVIAGPHRLAIVGGSVVAAGDPVGLRAIARIERDGVVLREPSGREIYVAIRPRKPPALGS
jgi:hypothetical protein